MKPALAEISTQSHGTNNLQDKLMPAVAVQPDVRQDDVQERSANQARRWLSEDTVQGFLVIDDITSAGVGEAGVGETDQQFLSQSTSR